MLIRKIGILLLLVYLIKLTMLKLALSLILLLLLSFACNNSSINNTINVGVTEHMHKRNNIMHAFGVYEYLIHIPIIII